MKTIQFSHTIFFATLWLHIWKNFQGPYQLRNTALMKSINNWQNFNLEENHSSLHFYRIQKRAFVEKKHLSEMQYDFQPLMHWPRSLAVIFICFRFSKKCESLDRKHFYLIRRSLHFMDFRDLSKKIKCEK